MNTEARRAASARYFAQREKYGIKRVTLWLSPESQAALEELREKFGSKDAAANDAIMALYRNEKGPVDQA